MKFNYSLFPACVGIVGSREWEYPHEVEDAVWSIIEKFEHPTEVVSGGADGVDSWAADGAVSLGHSLCEYRVDREEVKKLQQTTNLSYKAAFRKVAFERNERIVRHVRSYEGIVLAFNNSESPTKGTDNTIEHCTKLNVPCFIFEYGGNQWKSIINQPIILSQKWQRLILS